MLVERQINETGVEIELPVKNKMLNFIANNVDSRIVFTVAGQAGVEIRLFLIALMCPNLKNGGALRNGPSESNPPRPPPLTAAQI